MGWRELVAETSENIAYPWVAGRSLDLNYRSWQIDGLLPAEMGWNAFRCSSKRTATLESPCEPDRDKLGLVAKGYLVGNRIVLDEQSVNPDPELIAGQCLEVYLLEEGLDRFARISAGRMSAGSQLVFKQVEFPLGPEQEVYAAFLDGTASVDAIKGVSPALDAAFRMETWQRQQAEKRRLEAARRRREEEERLAKERRRQELVEKLGDGAGRRQMAVEDFAEAARSALAISGAVYLDHRKATRKHETVVQFRLGTRRFECTCDARTLQIIDAGICLTAHYDDPDFEGGTKGDAYFTLESLPAVIQEAQRGGKLVVYRHVD